MWIGDMEECEAQCGSDFRDEELCYGGGSNLRRLRQT